ncbi:unnamed protein product, partial [Mesorhabditis spiculigera]
MKFDEFFFGTFGEMGRYQKIQFALVTIPTMICAMHSYSWTFAAQKAPYRCALNSELGHTDTANYLTKDKHIKVNVDDCYNKYTKLRANWTGIDDTNTTCHYESCNFADGTKCQEYVFDHSKVKYTALEKWNFVCETQDFFKSSFQAAYYLGQMAGSIIFGILGDKIGRKKCFFLALVLQLVFGLLQAVVPWSWMYFIFRAITGFTHPGIFMIAVIIGMELVGPSYRKLAGVFSGMFYAVGQVLLGVLSYYITDFRLLHLAITGPTVIFLTYWWIVPESIRWLITMSKFEDADKVLQEAAKVNKVTLPDKWWETIDSSSHGNTTERSAATERQYSSADLFRTPQMLKRTLTVLYLWPVVSMTYYGLGIKPDVLGGDLHVSFILGALIELPALFIVYLTVDKIGRRPVLAGGFAITGITLLLNLVIPADLGDWAAIAQLMIAKGAITSVYAVIYTFTPELFPTCVRNTAMGYCSTIARVGAIAASYVSFWVVERFGKIVLVIPFGTLAITAAIATWVFLPETMGKHLPETIAEVEGTNVDRELQPLAPTSDSTSAKPGSSTTD